jgi:DNA polymerase I-like protein with 3'-5' exonuclease and polymerase domains
MRSPEGRASAEQPPPAATGKASLSHPQGRQAKSQPHAATELIGDRRRLTRIAEQVRNARTVALDIETYGERRGDGLDPWNGDIRLLSLRVENQQTWILDLRALGYDLGELKAALEAVEIIAHNAKFDLLWLRQKCDIRASKVFCTLAGARLLTAGTKPGNDLDKCLERYLDVPPAPDHSRSDWGSMFLTEDQLAYASRDVFHLHALSNKLWGELEHEALDTVARLEMQLVPVIVEMEHSGIAVDLHKQTAAEVLHKPLDQVTKEDRQISKSANFGLLYGQSAPGLVRYAASSYGVQLELDEAENIRRQFFRTYGHLRQWHGVSRNQADAGAREVRTVTGRRRLIPETASEWERFTALVNTPVQGGCADGMKQALVLIAQRLPAAARLISTVHDEVLVESPAAMADDVRDLVRSSMIEAMAALFPQVPIEVEAGSCSHWGEK